MQPNNQTSQTYGGQSLEPFAFDPNEREPEAAAGDYTFDIQNAKHRRKPPEKGSYHQLSLTLKITGTSTDNEESEKSIGGTIFTDITFYPKGERARAANMNKQNYLNLLGQCGIESDVMTTIDDNSFDELIELLKGREAINGSVRLSTVGEGATARTFVNVNFARPDESQEQEVEQPKARQASKAKPAAKGTSKRR